MQKIVNSDFLNKPLIGCAMGNQKIRVLILLKIRRIIAAEER
jgi:hypothetical protein